MKRLLIACITLGACFPAGLRAMGGEPAAPSPEASPSEPSPSEPSPSEPSPSEPSPAARAELLVQQLGADDYAVREQAARELVRLGMPALAALQAAVRNSDREIRYSSRRILQDVQQADFERRLQAFAEGRDDEVGERLPTWDDFRGVTGDSAESRKLFVEMQRNEPELLETLARNPRGTSESLDSRAQAMQFELRLYNREIPLGAIAAMLLAAGDERVTVPTQAASMLYGYCYQKSMQAALGGGEHEAEVRKLLGRWIARGDDSMAYQGLVLATQYELKEGLQPARRLIQSPGQQQYVVQYAVATVARLGDRKDIPLLEPLLRDASHLTHRRVGEDSRLVEVQLRDVALAALVHLSGQDYEDFGLRYIQPNPQTVFTTNSACFDSDGQRAAAIEKWRAYRETGRAESGTASDK